MRSPTVTPKLQRIAAQAARDPHGVLTTLAHLIDVDFLREAYRHTSKSSAPGIDGVTAQQYAEHLDEHRHDLHERLRSGRSQATPVERVWIEKEDGKQRPIGQPTFADKIVQREWRCCWKRSTSKTSPTARTASGGVAVHMTHCTSYGSGA